MIDIFRSDYNCVFNYFHKEKRINTDDVIIKQKQIGCQLYKYAEPKEDGRWAFGGSFLYTSNGIHKEFNNHPIPLHDRDMNLE